MILEHTILSVSDPPMQRKSGKMGKSAGKMYEGKVEDSSYFVKVGLSVFHVR